MQRYLVNHTDVGPLMLPDADGNWYVRSDVDARIAALESALAAMTERAERAEKDRDVLLAEVREIRPDLERAEKANAVLRAECEAWREWNDRDPHEPDRGIEDIENARAATDAAVALKGVE